MVVQLAVPSYATVESAFDGALGFDAAPRACFAAPPASGRRVAALPCRLAPGHAGHHETHVVVRRENGSIAGYTYAWLDATP
jgi:hypothetical protein